VNVTGITEDPTAAKNLIEQPFQHSELRRFIKVFFGRKVVAIGFAIIILLLISAVFAPLIAPYDPYQIDPGNKLLPISNAHLLGTDTLGRDTLSRIIYGARTSLTVSIFTVAASTIIGVMLGLAAGYFGGLAYSIIMRCVDALMAMPMLMLALLFSSLLGGGIRNVIISLAIAFIPAPCRIVCGQVLSIKQNDYVLAGRAVGMSDLRIMLFQILPNAISPLIVITTIGLGSVILAESGLSFLGAGINPPTAAWGSMVSEGYSYILQNPVLSFAPGVAIMLVVFAFNMVGDGLRDALDPKLRGVL
jgi:peptide/nickel transport system permease protein